MLAGQGSDYEEFKEMCTGKDLSTHAIIDVLWACLLMTGTRIVGGGCVAGAVLSVDGPLSL